jgi:hypothetical protein
MNIIAFILLALFGTGACIALGWLLAQLAAAGFPL